MPWVDLVRYALLGFAAIAAVAAVGILALTWLLNHPKD